MNVAVFAYSRQGCGTARRVMEHFSGCEVRAYTMEKYGEEGFLPIEKPSKPFYGPIFGWADAMVFVGSIGIAVREIAPHLRSKMTDPAVIGTDELARFVVPLLSGHIGGGNEMALRLAEHLGATPVVTTATDINRKFSVDAWAAKQGYFITNMDIAKTVSAEILERKVPIMSDFPIVTELPSGTVAGDSGDVGILISYIKKKPFDKTLLLVPPVLHLGIGCRRGTPAEAVKAAVEEVLRENGIHKRAIKCAASVDIKADEEGLLQYCREAGIPIEFYTAEELDAVEGDFSHSDLVKSVTGVGCVCERAAMVGASRLIVKKTAVNGVTVALAAEETEVKF